MLFSITDQKFNLVLCTNMMLHPACPSTNQTYRHLTPSWAGVGIPQLYILKERLTAKLKLQKTLQL